MSLTKALFIPAAALLLLSGCQEREAPPQEGVRTTVYDKAELESRDAGKEPILLPVQREEYLDTVQALVADFEKQIGALEQRIGNLQESARAELAGGMDDLKGLLNTAREQVARLQSAGTEEWDQARKELDATLEKLKSSLAQIDAKLPDRQ